MRRLAYAATIASVLTAAAISFAAADDRTVTEGIVRDLESSPKKDVAGEMLARAKSALDRGARLRAAGDEAHARLADMLARSWAEAARDVVRAVETEERAAAARRAATDAGAQAERERALLEESIAQSGRLRAQIEALERESKEQPARTSTLGADGGKPTPAVKREPARDGGAK